MDHDASNRKPVAHHTCILYLQRQQSISSVMRSHARIRLRRARTMRAYAMRAHALRMRAFASHRMRTHFSCVMRAFAYVIWACSASVMRAYARIRMRCERIRIACDIRIEFIPVDRFISRVWITGQRDRFAGTWNAILTVNGTITRNYDVRIYVNRTSD